MTTTVKKTTTSKKPVAKKTAPKAVSKIEPTVALSALRKKFASKEFGLNDIREAFKTKHGLRRANRLIDAGQLTYVGHNRYQLGGAKKTATKPKADASAHAAA